MGSCSSKRPSIHEAKQSVDAQNGKTKETVGGNHKGVLSDASTSKTSGTARSAPATQGATLVNTGAAPAAAAPSVPPPPSPPTPGEWAELTTPCANGYLISVGSATMMEALELSQFTRLVEGQCIYHRNLVKPGVFGATPAAASRNGVMNVTESNRADMLWSAAVSTSPLDMSESSTLNGLEKLQSLPPRQWNAEWLRLREKVASTESQALAIVASERPFSSTSPSFAKSVTDSYLEVDQLSSQFSWLGVLMLSSLHHATCRRILARMLVEYYKSEQGASSDTYPEADTEMSKRSPFPNASQASRNLAGRYVQLEQRRLMVDLSPDLAAETTLEMDEGVDRAAFRRALDYFRAADFQGDVDCQAILELASFGFEYQGVFFQVVRSQSFLKAVTREIAINSADAFNFESPCPPLLGCLDILGTSLLISPYLPEDWPSWESPYHLLREITPQAMQLLDKVAGLMAAKGNGHARGAGASSQPVITRILSPLPNPDKLRSSLAPALIPLDAPFDLLADQRTTLGAMCLGHSEDLLAAVEADSTNETIAQVLDIAAKCCDGRANALDLASKSLLSSYLFHWYYGVPSPFVASPRLALKAVTPFCLRCCGELIFPRVARLALVFSEGTLEPLLVPCDPWAQQEVIDAAAEVWGVAITDVLPYAPVDEGTFEPAEKERVWKCEVFGTKCAVWTSSVVSSPTLSGSFHSLSTRRPSRRRGQRHTLRPLPWDSARFAIVCAPSSLPMRPSVYLHKDDEMLTFPIGGPARPVMSQNGSLEVIPKSRIERAIILLVEHLDYVPSSRPFRALLHRMGLNLKGARWEIWSAMARNSLGDGAEDLGPSPRSRRRAPPLISPELSSLPAGPRKLAELVGCDIVATAVKKVIRHFVSDEAAPPHLGLECDALEALIPTLFGTQRPVDSESVSVARDALHLALWLDVLEAYQYVYLVLSPDLVADVMAVAKRCPVLLALCVQDQSGVQFASDFMMSLCDSRRAFRGSAGKKSAESVHDLKSLKGSQLGDGFSDRPPSLASSSRLSYRNYRVVPNWLQARVPFKMKSSLLTTHVIARYVTFKSLLLRQPQPLRAVATSLAFADAFPFVVNSAQREKFIGAVSLLLRSSEGRSVGTLLPSIVPSLTSLPDRGAHQRTLRWLPVAMAITLSAYAQVLFAAPNDPGNAKQALEKVDEQASSVLSQLPALLAKEREGFTQDLWLSALLLRGLQCLKASDYQLLMALFHTALTHLNTEFGDPSRYGAYSHPAVLFLSWCLAYLSQLTGFVRTAATYWDMYRGARLGFPDSPIPVIPPLMAPHIDRSQPADAPWDTPTTAEGRVQSLLWVLRQLTSVCSLNEWLSSIQFLRHPSHLGIGSWYVDESGRSAGNPSGSGPRGKQPSPAQAPVPIGNTGPALTYLLPLIAPPSEEGLKAVWSMEGPSVMYRLSFDAASAAYGRVPRGITVRTSVVLSWGSNLAGCLGLGCAWPFDARSSDNSKPTAAAAVDEAQINKDLRSIFSSEGVDVPVATSLTRVLAFKDLVIVAISSGMHHCAALDDSGAVWVWGAAWSQKGTPLHRAAGDVDRSGIQAKMSQPPTYWWSQKYGEIVEVAESPENLQDSGDQETTVETPAVSLCPSFQAPECDHSGRRFNPRNILHVPVPFRHLSVCFRTICCGASYTAAIAQDGSLYTWGDNTSGALGTGDFETRHVPTLVALDCSSSVSKPELFDPVIQVACGWHHSAAVTENGYLYTWGRGTEGQLGLPLSHLRRVVSEQQPPCASARGGKQHLFVNKPQRVRLFQLEDPPDSDRLKAIGLPTRTEDMGTSGAICRKDGAKGILVIAVPAALSRISGAKQNEDVEFMTVACGYSHTLALDIANSVWAWGDGCSGQLGVGKLTQNRYPPWAALPGSETDIPDSHRNTPCQIAQSVFKKARIRTVIAGLHASACLDQKSCLWVWGRNTNNILGQSVEKPLICDPAKGSPPKAAASHIIWSPVRSDCFRGSRLRSFCFGWSGLSALALSETGQLYRWGATPLVVNRYRRLYEPHASTDKEKYERESVLLRPLLWPGTEGAFVDAAVIGLDHVLVLSGADEDPSDVDSTSDAGVSITSRKSSVPEDESLLKYMH